MIRFALILFLIAVLILFRNWWEDFQAGNASHNTIYNMHSAMDMQETESESAAELPASIARPLQMQETVIDGYAYIGYLNIPVLDAELPVLSEWSDEGLKIAPARHFGATVTDDLVIAAHNYRRHFGALGILENGDEVTFTEMDGYVNNYVVREVVTIQATAVQEVINNKYDLILYTCTTGGQKRLAAYCERVEESE